MSKYRGGKITTGVQSGLNVAEAQSTDDETAKPKAPAGAITFKALRIPLNVSTPDGRPIEFTGGYFVTTDKKLISFLRKEVVPALAEELE